ncbi:MAG: hypothetical protein HY908_06215 [Myxococcales bacterium]|nr:hypothetical protein [Myxococcales bacterium]
MSEPSDASRQPSSRGARRRLLGPVLVAVAGVAVGVCASPGEAHAVPEILEPSTRPWFFTGGIGPSIVMAGDYGLGWGHRGCDWRWGGCWGGADAQFMLQVEIGYHFSGDGAGPALGFGMDMGFGGSFRIEPGLKFWYDIGPIADMAIYVTPYAQLGYGYVQPDYHAFNIQFGASCRIVLGDRGMLFMTPIGIDLDPGGHSRSAGSSSVLATWNIMFGGGVTF